MKIELIEKVIPIKYEPKTIQITFESQEDESNFGHFINCRSVSNLCDEPKIVARIQHEFEKIVNHQLNRS